MELCRARVSWDRVCPPAKTRVDTPNCPLRTHHAIAISPPPRPQLIRSRHNSCSYRERQLVLGALPVKCVLRRVYCLLTAHPRGSLFPNTRFLVVYLARSQMKPVERCRSQARPRGPRLRRQIKPSLPNFSNRRFHAKGVMIPYAYAKAEDLFRLSSPPPVLFSVECWRWRWPVGPPRHERLVLRSSSLVGRPPARSRPRASLPTNLSTYATHTSLPLRAQACYSIGNLINYYHRVIIYYRDPFSSNQSIYQ